MLYISLLFIFLIFSFINKNTDSKKCFCLSICFLALIMSLRFAQGTDYFNYKNIYLSLPNEYNNIIVNSYMRFYIEPFFYLLNVFAKRSGLGFQFVVIFCSSISFLLLYKTISKYSINKTFSLFILFCNYFFYYFNIIRQSLAMAIFIYAYMEFCQSNNKLKYYILCFICLMFHSASIICFLVPILLKINLRYINNVIEYTSFSIFCIILGQFIPRIMIKLLSIVIPRYTYYYSMVHFSIFPILVRYIFSVIVIHNKKRINTQYDMYLFKTFIYGSIIYYCLSSISIFSRFTDFIMFTEIILIPNIIEINVRKYLSIPICMLLFLYSSLFIKDIHDAIKQDNYFSQSVLDFPYITIFNKNKVLQEKIIIQNNKDLLLYSK